QPLVDVKTGTITGSEALIRWFHPEKGAISPALFIPIVERSDLIFPLGRWVIERACRQLVAWRAQGLPQLVVAVNLSAAQFKHHDLVGTIHDMLVETGVDPAQIQLEVTESIAMHNVELSIEILRQLRDLGLHISIDDFGTGYSSLNYLKRFPADKLKIDRSFVTDIGQHPDNAAIVRTIISLGHAIGTRVNVEGVETVEQFAFLRANGVDEAQGFLFAKPLPPDEFAALVCRPALWNVAALPA
ncbi:MAG: EAL domain-containing protein, partial [Rhodospirillales bacterium]|nr:EAL domain-containing protein [Rhodospirillales bacterium]